MPKTQRIRDPIHGLIPFRDGNEVDQLAWRLINTREFQRLRRIRQLGFSELVFPGATHTRFSHSVGVFHTARQLLEVIQRMSDTYDPDRARTATCAALLHDLGHGPFSHTFESVEKRRGVKKRHEEWTADLIRGDTEVHSVLEDFSSGLANDVAELLSQREPKDIYAAVVSSQFDADRLDYLRRDRYMTGTGGGGIDFDWLLDCLEVGQITMRVADEVDYVEVDGFYLNYKGLRAAEEYLLARYHLYSQVYMHKTTRGAEQILGALLRLVAERLRDGHVAATGLSSDHPVARYYHNELSAEGYLALDDSVVTSAVAEMLLASDEMIARLARRLQERRLYKCFDVGELARATGGDSLQRFCSRLNEEAPSLGLSMGTTLLSDDEKISAYGVYSFDERAALQKVLIGQKEGYRPEDIAVRSDVVKAIHEERLFRVYAPDQNAADRLRALWRETVS